MGYHFYLLCGFFYRRKDWNRFFFAKTSIYIFKMENKRILLIISGSIAAYKSLELIRRLKDASFSVRCILTKGGAEFITPLSVASLSGEPVFTDLFSLKDESEMGHIRLSREADLVIVAPASANLIAKMAQGISDDLASTVLLATDKPVMVAPAMNAKMWEHAATQRNLSQVTADGARLIAPRSGSLACGEVGDGRMAEPDDIVAAVRHYFQSAGMLKGKRVLVTSGPTQEALDPVRFLGNYSSGKQGHALAQALAFAGAEVTLVSGPVSLADPAQVKTVHVKTAEEMLAACEAALPVDIAICAAAVADWRVAKPASQKLKKRDGETSLTLTLEQNPDILATLSQHKVNRPALVVGFAAETDHVIENARVKLAKKQCDWLLVNDVSGTKVFGENTTSLTLLSPDCEIAWGQTSKTSAAERLTQAICSHFNHPTTHTTKQVKKRS